MFNLSDALIGYSFLLFVSPVTLAQAGISIGRCVWVKQPCYACVWCFRILHVYRKSIKWTWVEPFEMSVEIEQGSNFDLDNELQFLRSLKG